MKAPKLGWQMLSAAFLLLCACSGDSEDPWDPRGIYSEGKLNDEAVSNAREYTGAPLLWLGEEFDGMRLTHAESRYGIFTLVYGDCDSYKANPREPSCMPAVTLQLKGQGLMPAVTALTPQAGRKASVEEVRGVEVYVDSPNLVVQYGNGMTLTAFNLPGNTSAFLQSLQSANHKALGLEAVGRGEQLDAFTSGQ